MPITNCTNCETEFPFDFELGLNVKYYEAEASRSGFRAGGDTACCPNCEARYTPPQKTFGWGEIKIKTGFVMRRPDEIKTRFMIEEEKED